MVDSLVGLLHDIAAGRGSAVAAALDATPQLATAQLAREDEFFLAPCRAQLYAGDTALHVASCAYDVDLARELVSLGADVQARNRRCAEPLHAAVLGAPGNSNWNPEGQRAVIAYLVSTGADPNARAMGGVTPLHRAVRNRCSAAVEELLALGADASLANDHGSTASDLARWTTGRGGTGSEEAKAEQRIILDLLDQATAQGG